VEVGTDGGDINAGVLIPAYYPTRLRYRFGVTDNSVQEVELAGGSYYYAETPPVEETWAGNGVLTSFVTSENARAHRQGGAGGTTFTRVFGVIVNGVLQVEGVDYTQSVPGGPNSVAPALVTITFTTPPPNGAQIRAVYFTEVLKSYPQAVNADAILKPGAVRGRNIVVLVGTRGSNEVQTVTITSATGGTYTLSFLGAVTVNIAYDATAATVQTALEALATVGTGNVLVTGDPGGPYTVTFVGALGGANQPLMVADITNLTGAGAAVNIVETTAGGAGGNRRRLAGVQTFELEATVEGEVEREMGNEHITGRSITGTDTTGTLGIRPKDKDAFFQLLSDVTGVSRSEVFGYFNQNTVPVEIQIRNPKNPGSILKTIYVPDGLYQPPGTPARVNAATDFSVRFDSNSGTFREYKGARP
jgi:hypothetical protein